MKYSCDVCAIEYQAPPSQYARTGTNKRTCSRNCYNKSREGVFRCDNCFKEFRQYRCRKNGKNIFCGNKCHQLYIAKDVTHHPRWKGGKIVNGGYISIYSPEHPKANHNKVLEHRLVMEKHLGRTLDSDEIVHHINHNKADNRIENLMIVTRSEHVKLHPPK